MEWIQCKIFMRSHINVHWCQYRGACIGFIPWRWLCVHASYLLHLALMTSQHVTWVHSVSLRNPGSMSSRGKRLFSSLKHLEWLWCPPCLCSNGYSRPFSLNESSQNVKLTTWFRPVQCLKMCGAIYPFPHMSLFNEAHGQLHNWIISIYLKALSMVLSYSPTSPAT